MLYKNTLSQKQAVYAYVASTGAAKTGDAANITCYVSKDWAAGAALTDINPVELDAVHMPGWYVFDLAQAETNAEVLVFAPLSVTAGVVCDQVQVFMQDATISSRASATALAALNDISVADIIAGVSEGSLDLAEILRVLLAALAGKSTGGGTATVTFRDVADAKARITATLDTAGNRTALTLDGS